MRGLVEQGAAAVATMRTATPQPLQVQRMCASCEDEQQVSRMGVPGAAAPATAPPQVARVVSGGGRPLDGATRAFFEPRFGHDFGAVRVHDDAQADASARAVAARAYTVGAHVVFRAGGYAPSSVSGRQVLAHELAHVVQQRGATMPSGGLRVAPASDASEREADRVAASALTPTR